MTSTTSTRSSIRRTLRKPYTRRAGPWSWFLPTSWGPSSLPQQGAMCTSASYRRLHQDAGDIPAEEQGTGRRFPMPLRQNTGRPPWSPHPTHYDGHGNGVHTSRTVQGFHNGFGIALTFAETATPRKLGCRKGTSVLSLPSQGAHSRAAIFPAA